MPHFEVVLIALALSMDCFAVSFSVTACQPNFHFKNQLTFAALFGIFQGGMPFVGYYIGHFMHSYIAAVDHWIAGGILFFIGAKMIFEAFAENDNKSCKNYMKFSTVLLLSIATSIDALAVGFSFSFLQIPILFPTLTIGLITIFVSIFAFKLGKVSAKYLKSQWAMIFGGIVLIGICIKIILEHTLMS